MAAIVYLARAPIGAALGLYASSSFLSSLPEPAAVALGVVGFSVATDILSGSVDPQDVSVFGFRKMTAAATAALASYLVPGSYFAVSGAAMAGDWLIPAWLNNN